MSDKRVIPMVCPRCGHEGLEEHELPNIYTCQSCQRTYEMWYPPLGSEGVRAGSRMIIVQEDRMSGKTPGGLVIPPSRRAAAGGPDLIMRRYQFTGLVLSIGSRVAEEYPEIQRGMRIFYGLGSRVQEFRYRGVDYVGVDGMPRAAKQRVKRPDGSGFIVDVTVTGLFGIVTGKVTNLDRGTRIPETYDDQAQDGVHRLPDAAAELSERTDQAAAEGHSIR